MTCSIEELEHTLMEACTRPGDLEQLKKSMEGRLGECGDVLNRYMLYLAEPPIEVRRIVEDALRLLEAGGVEAAYNAIKNHLCNIGQGAMVLLIDLLNVASLALQIGGVWVDRLRCRLTLLSKLSQPR